MKGNGFLKKIAKRGAGVMKIWWLLVWAVCFSVTVSAAVSQAAQTAQDGSVPEYQTFEELNGKTISMLTGAPFENLISSKVKEVRKFTYFPSLPDMILAIKTHKSDAGFMNNAVAVLAANRDPALSVFPESLGETAFGLGFAKGDARSAQWQAAYNRISEETRKELWEKWTGADEDVKRVSAQDWPGKNGAVTVAACDAMQPMSYVGEGGELLGLDIETILLIAKELDVHVSFTPMDFSAALSSVSAGKADIACGSIVITDERRETMDFVEYLPASYVLIVRAGSESAAYASVDELAGKRIGVLTGTIHDGLVEKRLPTAKIVYFNTIADMLDALMAGKIDAMIRPQSGALFISYQENSITWLDEHLTDADVGFAFPKTEDGAALRESFSEYIRTLRADGELETLREKWFDEDESVKTMMDFSTLPATNGTLRLAATGTQMPFNYVRDNTIVGFEIELAARFCERGGYGLQVEQMNFDGVLASVQAGKCDFACACLSITQ